jgi:hypothetical protein
MRFYLEPWTTWPRAKTEAHRRPMSSPFRAPYAKTCDMLVYELGKLKVEESVIQLNGVVRGGQYKSGLPMESMRTESEPGVILSFTRAGRPLALPCDRFRTWQDNFRAITKALAHLREADRYGVTQSGEQYRGWEALPPPGAPAASAAMTLERALDIIAKWSRVPQNLIREIPTVREAAIKEARRAAHPDKGASADVAADVGQAAEVIKKELGG